VTATPTEETKEEAKAEEANSKGFKGSTIANPEKGVYCISGLTVEVPIHNVMVTVDNKAVEVAATVGFFATATVGKSFFVEKEKVKLSACASTQITVETWELKDAAGSKLTESHTANAPFYIAIN